MIPKRAKVVVIGGGVFGTSAAFQLADSGITDVVLVDKGPIGCGTTQFAAGQTGHLRADLESAPFRSYCADFFETFQERTGYPLDFHQPGSLRIAVTDRFREDLDRRAEVAAELGHEAKFLTVDEATRMAPTLQLEKAAGILLSPRDGYMEPRSVAVGYAASARDRGVVVATNTTVSSIDTSGGKIKGVTTDRGSIETEFVVLAAGAWTRKLGQATGISIPATPVRHQAFVTVPLSIVNDSQPIVRITEPQIYVRPESGGLLVGGYGYRPMSFDMDEFPGDFEIAALPADQVYYDELRKAAEAYFPLLRDLAVVQERRGLPTMAPDAQFIAAESPAVSGLIVASACSVGGIHHSPGVGRIVADIVLGQQTWPWSERLGLGRFGSEYDDDAHLRSRCERAYEFMYQGVV